MDLSGVLNNSVEVEESLAAAFECPWTETIFGLRNHTAMQHYKTSLKFLFVGLS